MSDSAKSHYEVLGLQNDASFLEIKSQYRKLLLEVNCPHASRPTIIFFPLEVCTKSASLAVVHGSSFCKWMMPSANLGV